MLPLEFSVNHIAASGPAAMPFEVRPRTHLGRRLERIRTGRRDATDRELEAERIPERAVGAGDDLIGSKGCRRDPRRSSTA